MSSSRTKPSPSRRRAVVLAELAIFLPFFLLLVVGVVELGRAVNIRQDLVNAAREGARRACEPHASTAVVTATIQNYLDHSSLAGATPTITINNGTEIASLTTGAQVTVNVVIAFADVDWGVSGFVIGGNLAATTTIRRQ